MSLSGKTLFITGSSRGIGLAIALRAAKDGANVAVVARTSTPHPKFPGTIYTTASAVEAEGGKALPIACDISDHLQVRAALRKTAETFGGIDICINNAGAVALTGTLRTSIHRFDLMYNVNVRGTFLCSKLAYPFLTSSENPHILNVSPPLDLSTKWFSRHPAYSITKYGMSMCTLGMAEEFRSSGIAVNSLWPLTTVDTAATRFAFGIETLAQMSRAPSIMADAAYAIITQPSRACTGNFFIDEEVLRDRGITDFSPYAPATGSDVCVADVFVPEEVLERTPTRLMRTY